MYVCLHSEVIIIFFHNSGVTSAPRISCSLNPSRRTLNGQRRTTVRKAPIPATAHDPTRRTWSTDWLPNFLLIKVPRLQMPASDARTLYSILCVGTAILPALVFYTALANIIMALSSERPIPMDVDDLRTWRIQEAMVLMRLPDSPT